MSFQYNEMFFVTLIDKLANDIREENAKHDFDNLPFAAERVIASRLGYDAEDINFVDGAGDRGIDFWYASEGGLYFYQVKTHELNEDGSINYTKKFNNQGVQDLMRIPHFLLSENTLNGDHRLVKVKETFNRLVRNHKSQEIENPLHIYLTLIILGESLTEPAFEELASFEQSLDTTSDFSEIPIQFHVAFQNIKNILASEWRQKNDEWKDVDGTKRDSIRLTPLRQSDRRDYLNDNKSAIFYCKAFDLVTAYDDFGYQIFAPNVRANIKNSNVNSAIQESASHIRSMKEFRFLNNGLTIICNSYRLPSGQRPAFEVVEPGVVNGLQTVVALHRAYQSLHTRDKAEFDENCYVLVRLLRRDAVPQISEVVFATNNQNPMQPRNLVSNSPEQTYFFLYFANNLGWFYEAKQGAWDAFRKDEKSWRPRINKAASTFRVRSGDKRIDNHELAQDWLAFLGFADRSANDRKHLFNKGYYELIFQSRPNKHGYGQYRSIDEALNDSILNTTPDPHMMLATHLAHRFVDEVVPSAQANKKEALERNGIFNREKISQAEEDKILSEDHEYSLNQALGTMSYIFVEFIGFTLFKIYGSDAHRCGQLLLGNHSWQAMFTSLETALSVQRARGIDKDLAEDDLLVILWLFFREAVQTLMGAAWKVPYINARYKPRFVLNNRNQIYQELLTMDQSIQRRVPIRIWAYGIQEGEGFFGYVQRIISNAQH
jgi:hypothetical protein